MGRKLDTDDDTYPEKYRSNQSKKELHSNFPMVYSSSIASFLCVQEYNSIEISSINNKGFLNEYHPNCSFVFKFILVFTSFAFFILDI